jgi:UDP-glucose 4-epimerase
MDLVDVHIPAVEYLVHGGSSVAFNCDYGHGYSDRQVIDVARKVTWVDCPVRETRRCDGDPYHSSLTARGSGSSFVGIYVMMSSNILLKPRGFERTSLVIADS